MAVIPILSPCSKCGALVPNIEEVMRMNIKNNWEKGHKIKCSKCGAETADFHTKRGAAEAWNNGKLYEAKEVFVREKEDNKE